MWANDEKPKIGDKLTFADDAREFTIIDILPKERKITERKLVRNRGKLPHYNMNDPTIKHRKYGQLPAIDDLVNGAKEVNLLAPQFYMGKITHIEKNGKFILTSFGVRFVRVIGQTWVSVNAEKKLYLVRKIA